MVVTVKSFLRKHSEVQIEGKLGQEESVESNWDYNSSALKLIMVLCGAVAVVGMGILVFGSSRESVSLMGFGLTIFIVGTYQLIATMKEKANLDLLFKLGNGLSRAAKEELIKVLVEKNAGASSGLLGLVESLFAKNKQEAIR